MSLWLGAGLSPADRERLVVLLEGGELAGSVTVADRPLRRVLRAPLDLGAVYVKQNRFPRLAVRLRYALRASPTQHERDMLEACAALGLRVPEPVGEATRRAPLGPVRACLATRALPEGRAPEPTAQLELADRLAALGVLHPDLHGDNLRVLPDGSTALLDLQSCRLREAPLGTGPARRMRAKACHDLAGRIGHEALAELCRERYGPDETTRLLDLVGALERQRLASRARHLDRSSSRVERRRLGMFGRRLQRRGASLPGPFGPEHGLEVEPLGLVRVARDEAGLVRIRAPGGLHRVWIAAMLAQETGRNPLPVVAWERDPGLWRRRESLYIGGPIPDAELVDLLLLFRPEVDDVSGI